MKINIYGDTEKEKILLLHPTFLNGDVMNEMFKDKFSDYCIIAPDLSMHGIDSKSEFESAEIESNKIRRYLVENGMHNIKLVYGMCLGARVALELINNTDLSFDIIFLDGMVVRKDAKLKRYYQTKDSIKKLQKAKKNPASMSKKMTQLFGTKNGAVIGDTFKNMSPESLKQIIFDMTTFGFYAYKRELQENMYFTFGSKEVSKSYIKSLKTRYPFANYIIHDGYSHCQFILNNKEQVFDEIFKLIQKSNWNRPVSKEK